MFYPEFTNGDHADQPVSKVVCVGRNFADHARELNNPIPEAPLLFVKPPSAVVSLEQPLNIPSNSGAVHHELELALWIRSPLVKAGVAECLSAIGGLGLALDLTLRDKQDFLKANSHPWDIAKGFDGSCPVSKLVPCDGLSPDFVASFSLTRNGKLQQEGNTRRMLFSFARLLSEMSHSFRLDRGDLVLTGTPKGVGPIESGDRLVMSSDFGLSINTEVL